MRYRIFGLLLLIVTFIACNQRTSEYHEYKDIDSAIESSNIPIPSKNIVYCISSPQLTNIYLKKLGVYPEKSLINSVNNNEKYTTSLKKALNIGVYSVDLGYINLYRTDENTEQYLNCIVNLAKDIGMGLIFNKETIEKLLSYKEKHDSLSILLTDLFAKADTLLKNNSRSNIGAYIVAGAWIESFYLLISAYNDNKNDKLLSYIYQQKFVLDNIIKILSVYYHSSKEFDMFFESLVEIAYNFDVVDFRYIYRNPYIKESKSGLIIIDNECKIVGSDEGLKNIIDITIDLREKIIS